MEIIRTMAIQLFFARQKPKNLSTICAILIMLACLPHLSYAEGNIGLGYPFLSFKYTPKVLPLLSCEGKYALGGGINVYAARTYFNFLRRPFWDAYAGVEYGAVYFNAHDLQGTGREYNAFLGLQVNLTHYLSLDLDIAPTYIEVTSENFSEKGLDWVGTVAVYLRVF